MRRRTSRGITVSESNQSGHASGREGTPNNVRPSCPCYVSGLRTQGKSRTTKACSGNAATLLGLERPQARAPPPTAMPCFPPIGFDFLVDAVTSRFRGWGWRWSAEPHPSYGKASIVRGSCVHIYKTLADILDSIPGANLRFKIIMNLCGGPKAGDRASRFYVPSRSSPVPSILGGMD